MLYLKKNSFKFWLIKAYRDLAKIKKLALAWQKRILGQILFLKNV